MDQAELTAHVVALTQKVDKLTQGLHDMQVENHALRMNLAALQAAPDRDLPEPKIGPPEYFPGERKKYRQFINSCQILFDLRPRTYRTDRVKIRTMISDLRGEPQAWAHTLMERDDPMMNSLPAFIDAMNQLYEDTRKQATASSALRALKQGRGPVEEYISEFKRWAMETEWNNISLRDQFREGLSEGLKDELARVEPPDTLERLMHVCTSLDRRFREHRAERGSGDRNHSGSPSISGERVSHSPSTASVPMELCALKGPLSQTEKQRRRLSNLCLYCASPAHLVEQCPFLKRKPLGEQQISHIHSTPSLVSTSHIRLPLTLQWDQNRVNLEAMIDTGASGNFIFFSCKK